MPCQYLELILECADADEQAYELIELGFSVIEILGPTRVRCFLTGPRMLDQLDPVLAGHGFRVISHTACHEENWLAQCTEVWEPLRIGRILVMPNKDGSSTASPSAAAESIILNILPGTGFGTGHHPTTRLLLEVMQELPSAGRPQNDLPFALDLGTGSGILAIACQKLFGGSVAACDIDPLALVNARTNRDLNNSSDQVHLAQCSLNAIRAQFSMVIANIYPEVLCELEPGFRECVRAGGVLLLSGILEEKAPLIISSFGQPEWEIENRRDLDGWCAFLVRRSYQQESNAKR